MIRDETLVRMPRLADTLVEGTVGQWLKQVGELVGQGEALASIETDKVSTELPSPVAGRLLEQLVPEGRTVPVDTAIARIGEATPADMPDTAPQPKSTPPRPTPVAARLLAEHGLTPEQVATRPGRLTKDEVLEYVEISRSRRGDTLLPLTTMRRAIADHMSEARRTIPHGQTVMDVDLTRLVAWRDQHKAAFQAAERANLSFTVVFVYALARALAADADGAVAIGVAVALDAGLIVPVLRNADTLSLGATARGIADLAGRGRGRTLEPAETLGARMTVTNVGSFGNLSAAPIVPLGQVAILGPGLVERRPMPSADGGVRLGWRCRLCLMFDRRALDDMAADRLLRRIVGELARVPEAS